jgi:hypothetical protein
VIVEAPIDRVPVSRKTFAEMARYSPALAEIQPIVYFPGGWEVYLCDKTDTTQCEIKGGWFMFAVRDAVAKRGYYKDAPSANAFYTRVRDELESACTSGKLTCLPFGTSIYPVFRGSDVVKTLGAFMRGMQSVLFFEPFGLSERELSSQGNDSELHAFRSVLDILATIHRFYGDGFAWLSLIFLVLFTVVRIKKWDFPPALFSILSIFGVTLVTRIVVFSYVDVTLFPAFGSNYLSPCYPCAIVLIFSLISSVKSPV